MQRRAGRHGAASLEHPSTATVRGARGSIDVPEPGATLQRGALRFAGWALLGSNPPGSVRLVVNDAVTVEAETGVPRHDVPVALGERNASTSCGWEATIDLRVLPPGEVHVQLVVGESPQDPAPHCVANNAHALRGHGISGAVDLPTDGAEVVGDLISLKGWAHTPRLINAVEIECDGVSLGLARLGLSRPDVEDAGRGIGPLCGWEFRGVLDVSAEQTVTLSAIATDLDGSRATLGTTTVTMRPNALTDDELAYAERLARRNRESVAPALGAVTRRRRRVLIFTHSLSIGGGQLYLQDLLREVMPHLESCTVVTPTGGILGPELEAMGVDVVINARGWANDIASYEGKIREFEHLIAGSGCSTVLLNTLGEFAAADAAQRVGVPTIWAIHESMELADWIERNSLNVAVSAFVRSRIESALRGASRLVFEADATRRLYSRFVDVDRSLTVNYAVDVAAIDAHRRGGSRSAVRASLGLPEDAVVLLCVGVFEERKSQGCLIDAFGQVANAHPDAMLVLVGDHPAPHSSALHRAVPEPLVGRVRLVPITSDIWDWYRAADVLVSASDVESLPRSMLEAMLFECPVLSVSVFGVPELIRDGENGWLVEARDMASLIAGFHRVLRLNRAARDDAGRKGRDLVVGEYRADRFGDAYLRLIDELGAGATGATAPSR